MQRDQVNVVSVWQLCLELNSPVIGARPRPECAVMLFMSAGLIAKIMNVHFKQFPFAVFSD